MSGAGQQVPTRVESVRAARRVANVLTCAGAARFLVEVAPGERGLELPPRASALLAFDPFASVNIQDVPPSVDAGDVSRASRRAARSNPHDANRTDVGPRPSMRNVAPESTPRGHVRTSQSPSITPARVTNRHERAAGPLAGGATPAPGFPAIVDAHHAGQSHDARSLDGAAPASVTPAMAAEVIGRLQSVARKPATNGGSTNERAAHAAPATSSANTSSGMALLAELTSAIHDRSVKSRTHTARENGSTFPPLGGNGSLRTRTSPGAGANDTDAPTPASLWHRAHESRLFPRAALRAGDTAPARAESPALDTDTPAGYESRPHAHQRDMRPHIDVVDVIATALRDEARRHGVDMS